jgi:diguanylate cyclase (GGDEF)-like protein/PAS domain S-box-containing protein
MNTASGFACGVQECAFDHRDEQPRAATGPGIAPPEGAPASGVLLVSSAGMVLRQTRFSDALPDLTGLHLGSVFESLSGPRVTLWSRVMADCVAVPRNYVWRLRCADRDRPVQVECACLHTEGAGEWLLRLSDPQPDAGSRKLEMLAQAAHQTDDAVMITCAGGLIEYVNPAFERSTGYRADEVLGRSPGMLKSGRHGAKFYAALWDTINGGHVFRAVFTNRRKNGELYFEEKTISPIRDEWQRISHFVATSKDVSERIRAHDQLEYLANMDTLTDLPNRRLFMDRLNQAMQRATRLDRQLAVLFIDLDRFKVINDTLGHRVGDQLLTEVAGRLRACVRTADTVARLGGDEFTILLEDVASRQAVGQIADKILSMLGQGIRLDDRQFFISASVGITLFPDDAQSIDELLSRADLSMYQAKSAGRNTRRFYEQRMDQHAHSDFSAEIALHGALERREFFLVYQPIVDAASGRVLALEALLRWNSPDLGVVAPDRFIPILEETGLIVPVSRWSLREALAEVRRMQQSRPDMKLAFNLSGRQLRDDDLVGDISSALVETGFDPHMLELEITESMLMEDLPRTSEIMAALDAMGVSLAIDDFGTGYSSLAYLMRFSVRTLKIDRSFVRELDGGADAATIVRAILSLAGSMGLEIVAEGVETDSQFAHLRELGCHRLQGYLFGRPAIAGDLLHLPCFRHDLPAAGVTSG